MPVEMLKRAEDAAPPERQKSYSPAEWLRASKVERESRKASTPALAGWSACYDEALLGKGKIIAPWLLRWCKERARLTDLEVNDEAAFTEVCDELELELSVAADRCGVESLTSGCMDDPRGGEDAKPTTQPTMYV